MRAVQRLAWARRHLHRRRDHCHQLHSNVLWSLEVNDVSGGVIVAVVFFHFFVGLMVLAWAYTCFTDPGVPPGALAAPDGRAGECGRRSRSAGSRGCTSLRARTTAR